jgi:hypothetical protein
MSSTCLPLPAPPCGLPFPPSAPRGTSSPTSQVLRDTPTSAARLTGSLRSPSDTRVASAPSLSPPADALAGSLGSWGSATPAPIQKTRETADLPGSWGTLTTVRLGLGPRWDRHARPIQCVGAAPACVNNEGSRRENFRGSMSKLSVWLSTLRDNGRPPPRKTCFRLLACSTGRDWLPAGFR